MPYSWGDDVSTWRNPGRYDYGAAKRAYVDPTVKLDTREYVERYEPNNGLVNPHKKELVSKSKNPIIVGIDCTGSMSEWPAEIFDRLPLFAQTLAKYREDVEISFSVIGDAYSDQYPLQIAQFAKGVELDELLNAFYPEGGGGGQTCETYELWAYFMLNHVKTPNAEKPFMIIMGDEDYYKKVNKDQIQHYIGDKITEDVDAEHVWDKLAEKFNIFLLRKEYFSEESDQRILESWRKVLGRQKVIHIPCKERAVDVAMGIIARGWGKYGDFRTNIEARQDEENIKRVEDAIKHIPDGGLGPEAETVSAGASAGAGDSDGGTSKKLV